MDFGASGGFPGVLGSGLPLSASFIIRADQSSAPTRSEELKRFVNCSVRWRLDIKYQYRDVPHEDDNVRLQDKYTHLTDLRSSGPALHFYDLSQ